MIRTAIIDDEVQIRAMLAQMLELYCPDARLVGEADGVESGLRMVRHKLPELVLLDISMADGTGFDFLERSGDIDFKIIFITAYQEYAVRAFKYSALDYLLKPVDPDELSKAIKRAEKIIQSNFHKQLEVLKENLGTDIRHKKMVLKTLDQIYLVNAANVIRCDSDSGYTTFYLQDNRKITVSHSIGEFEEILEEQGFLRVHKSHIVNLAFLDHFDKAEGGYVVMTDGSRIPVASRKRDTLLELFDKLGE